MIIYEIDEQDNIIVTFTSDIKYPDGFKDLTSKDVTENKNRRLESLLRGADLFMIVLELSETTKEELYELDVEIEVSWQVIIIDLKKFKI